MKYGYFDDKAREYVITRSADHAAAVDQPSAVRAISVILSHRRRLFYYRDARLRWLTRGRYNNARRFRRPLRLRAR